MFHLLADSNRWKHKRAEYMQAARGCRKALTVPKYAKGFLFMDRTLEDGAQQISPTYSLDDPRVKAAVGRWVSRARRAHAIALGREPVIDNFMMICEGGDSFGSFYAFEGSV